MSQGIHNVKDIVGDALKSSRLLKQGIIKGNWEQIVGKDLGRKTYVAGVKERVLYVNTENPVMLHQLSFVKWNMLEEVNKFLGIDYIKDIMFRVKKRGVEDFFDDEIPEDKFEPNEIKLNSGYKNFIEEETIETEEMQSEYYSSFGMDTNGYTEKFHELADAYRKCMDKITFTEEDGKEQAEQVLEDLGIDGMGLVDSDRTVWFPNGACSERNGLGLGSDALWQGDLDRGLPGYLYCFSKSVEGITSVPDGVVAEETVDSYVPPFQVETISILITEEGIKYFKWDGISEEVCTVTENTKLLPFEKIQAKLTDQIFYWYSGKGQSANDTTALEYDVVNAKLQYTYTTAYQEPKHAWLVPAWIFTVRESIGGNSLQELSYVINAYDGSVIGEAY